MSTTELSPWLVRLMAVVCGAFAACLWFAQPLLDDLSAALHVSSGTAGLIVAAAQLGYVIGLLAIVPRGDSVDRRRLTTRLTLVAAAGLAASAVAPSLAVLMLATAVVGVTTAVAQILVPLAGDLAAPDERGRVVGVVMSGLLIGILLSRTVSGLVAGLLGWRAVYGLAAATMLVLAVALWRRLPDESGRADGEHRGRGPLAEVGVLVRVEPELQRRMVLGALGLGAFSMLWTALTLVLSAEHGLGPTAIGLFGLAGLAGALAARRAGVIADRGNAERSTVGWLLVALAGWGLIALQGASLVLLVAGLVVYDAGQQGHHITNQTVTLNRWPGSRSRVTTAYITSCFAGATLGSVLASVLWSAGGWTAVCTAGAGLTVAAGLVASPLGVLTRSRRAASS